MANQKKPLVRERVVEYYYCGHCKNVLDGEVKHCPSCGTKVNWGKGSLNIPAFKAAAHQAVLKNPSVWEFNLKSSLELEDMIREKRKELGDDYLKNDVGIDVRNLPE